MAAEHTWMLCNGQGSALAELTTAAGKQLAFRRNTFAEASCSISCDDSAALLVTEALKTDWPQLKCWRRAEGASSAVPVFIGNLAPIREDAEVGSTMQLVARSPFARMLNSPLGNLVASAFNYTATDAGAIAANLVLQAPATTWRPPLLTGTIEATKTRDIAYPVGQNAGEAIVNLANMLDGFDFAERFQSFSVFIDFLVRQGTVQPNARFEYGDATMANLRSVSKTTAPPVNWVILLGANGIFTEQTDAASIATYGPWKTIRSFSSISVQATLDERAKSLLRPKPITTVQMVPETNAPNPWDDFYLGDTVQVYARRGSLQIDTAARVNAFTVVIDDNGIEAVAIPDPQTPDEEAALYASLEVEVTPA